MKSLLLCTLLSVVGSLSYAGALLSFSPISQAVTVGSPASVGIDISGLGGGTALGVFDITVAFDPALLSFSTISFGNQLDLFGFGDIQSVAPGSGLVDIFELSLESASDLNSFQAASFRLATLSFDTLAVGASSPISFSSSLLGDADGNAISAATQDGVISIVPASPVPEPASVTLLATVLTVMVLAGCKSFKRSAS